MLDPESLINRTEAVASVPNGVTVVEYDRKLYVSVPKIISQGRSLIVYFFHLKSQKPSFKCAPTHWEGLFLIPEPYFELEQQVVCLKDA